MGVCRKKDSINTASDLADSTIEFAIAAAYNITILDVATLERQAAEILTPTMKPTVMVLLS
jgi:hypothetical protein